MQDGGVRANNPLAIALKESTVIWPTTRGYDLLLSIGTGFSSSSLNRPRDSLEAAPGGALPRMIRATLSSPCMDGEQGFYEALNYIPDHTRPDVFRLNHAIEGQLPPLDDTSRLLEMSSLPFAVPDELVRALLASAFFFFELDERPTQNHNAFVIQGSIMCTRADAHQILDRVLFEFPNARFQTARGQELGPCGEQDGCGLCGFYRKKVQFHVNSLEEIISIEVTSGEAVQKIGGFPISVREIQDAQWTDAYFGREDHQAPGWPPKRSCHCREPEKRHIEFLEPPLGLKRRRL